MSTWGVCCTPRRCVVLWLVVCRYTGVAVVDGRRPGEAVGVQL